MGDIYNAEKILSHKVEKGVTKYRIKWKGYPVSESTWEPIEHILDRSLLESYNKNPKPVSTGPGRPKGRNSTSSNQSTTPRHSRGASGSSSSAHRPNRPVKRAPSTTTAELEAATATAIPTTGQSTSKSLDSSPENSEISTTTVSPTPLADAEISTSRLASRPSINSAITSTSLTSSSTHISPPKPSHSQQHATIDQQNPNHKRQQQTPPKPQLPNHSTQLTPQRPSTASATASTSTLVAKTLENSLKKLSNIKGEVLSSPKIDKATECSITEFSIPLKPMVDRFAIMNTCVTSVTANGKTVTIVERLSDK